MAPAPGAGRRANRHIRGIHDQRPNQERRGLGRICPIAVGQDHHVEVSQGNQGSPDCISLTLLGNRDHPNTKPASNLARAIG